MTSLAGRVLAAAAILSFANGCASLSTVQTAHALQPGEAKVTLTGGLAGGGVPGLTFGAADATREEPLADLAIPVPQAEAELRMGVAPRIDAAVRVFLLGVAGDVKFQFLQLENWDAAFVPGFSVSYISFSQTEDRRRFAELDQSIPVLFGRHLGRSSSFVFGPKVQARHSIYQRETPLVSGRGERFILLAGGTSVLNLYLGKGIFLVPELSVYRDMTEQTGIQYSGAIGLSFTTNRKHLRPKKEE